MRKVLLGGLAAILVSIAALVGIDLAFGHMAVVAIYRHGGAVFLPISPTSDRLSPSIRLALSDAIPEVAPGAFAWRAIGDGIDEAELPVMAGSKRVDSILLARVDPAKNRIIVRNDASGGRTIDDWMTALDARLIVNGSYYAPSGKPDTPFLEAGQQIGPGDYVARQGALTIQPGGVAIRDLAHLDWKDAFRGASDALVSYPLLLDGGGKARPIKASNWLANRTFVGTDKQGRVIFGTTTDAFFSLARLSAFLQSSPLDLAAVLNLDGGPVACQAIAVGTFRRDFCGNWELNEVDGQPKKLSWFFGRWALPVVVAVVRK